MIEQISIHSSVDGCIGCFHTLAVVSNVGMNIEMHVSFQISVFYFFFFFRYISRSGIFGSYGSSILDFFEKTSLIFNTVAVQV